jgi:hypothetical protein
MRALSSQAVPPLVVPGGGVLADAVRALCIGGGPSMETAHGMALLALDQGALWLAELAVGAHPGRVVRSEEDIGKAFAAGALPVLAPSGWLERENPLPASWEVTSDSIAAWVAGRVGARRLLLLKSFAYQAAVIGPREIAADVDPFFLRALPPHVECRFVDGSNLEEFPNALSHHSAAGSLLVRE